MSRLQTKDWNVDQFFEDSGIKPEQNFTDEDFSQMTDHELRMMLVGAELTAGEFEAFEKEWNNRFGK